MTRKAQPHHLPVTASAARDYPGLFTPERIAQNLETLQLGIAQFKEELAAGPSSIPSQYGFQLSDKASEVWEENILRRIQEWEVEAYAYQALVTEAAQ